MDVAARAHLAWFALDRPDLLVVDGCPDTAAAARSVGIATVNICRPGVASRGPGSVLEPLGAGELAPYPGLLEPRGVPRWLRERTVHAGLLSRYGGTSSAPSGRSTGAQPPCGRTGGDRHVRT